ncbi:MAG: DUF4260 family protein [Chitinophagaceae bacterium]|nr:MAG: DUF4260 family protein [Chitinophagaceae bacterium]
MSFLLTLEEAGMFLLSIILFSQLDYTWWVFPAFLLLPDLSMLGYLSGPKAGAWLYNFVHHKLVAVTLFALGLYLQIPGLQFAGIILFGHSSMDRMFGYGLKYTDSFSNTHLGKIGKEKNRATVV